MKATINGNATTHTFSGCGPLVPTEPPAPAVPTLVKKKELARRLSVSMSTIDNWVAKRLIPYIKVTPRFYLYEVDAVLAAIKKHYEIDAKPR